MRRLGSATYSDCCWCFGATFAFFYAFSKILRKKTLVPLLFWKLRNFCWYLWALKQNISAFLSFAIQTWRFFSSYFSFVLTLKTIHTHTGFISQHFWKRMKKKFFNAKNDKKAFLTINNICWCIFKNTIQKNIYASIILKTESEPKDKEHFI